MDHFPFELMVDGQFPTQSFVRRDSKYTRTCLLCNQGPMQSRQINQHLTGNTHRSRVQQLETIKQGGIRQWACKHLYSRVERISHTPWKQHVQSLMYQHICLCRTKQCPSLAEVQQVIVKYELMEKISLLELAVWKANCLRLGRCFESMQEILDAWAMNEDFSPDNFKLHCRATSGISVIATLVISFLDPTAH